MMLKIQITAGTEVRFVWEDEEGTAWDTPTPGVMDGPSDWQHTADNKWLFQGRPAPVGNASVTVVVLGDEDSLHLGGEWSLTTNHPASIHGVPVLVNGGGGAYGPQDTVELAGKAMPAHMMVRWLARWNDKGGAPFVRSFLGK